jgi:hypothetical protein
LSTQWIYDGDTGQHSLLDMEQTTGPGVVTDLTTIDGISYAVGAGECNGALCSMLVALRPLGD